MAMEQEKCKSLKPSMVGSSSTILSTPSLLDLLNDDDVAPQDFDREALEQALFNQPDPYDLAETDPRGQFEDYIRLDSVLLEKIISAGKKKDMVAPEGVVPSQMAEATVEAGNEDWDIED
ncbi:hypothetical protein B0H14DRAFT_2583155 [Mycena olivaceomarginata]|nr:hypothetical protein B0H14DRAFT_2583155 [Mycena olivaceomarginata]